MFCFLLDVPAQYIAAILINTIAILKETSAISENTFLFLAPIGDNLPQTLAFLKQCKLFKRQ